jgi:3-oxoadipate enol-lactonase
MTGLDAAIAGLARVRSERLALQLGGPVGTLDALGSDAEAVAAGVARRLGLPVPLPAWHAERSRVADLAGALGTAAVAIEAVAVDLVFLAQAEVAEVADRRPDRGGSSSMDHKRNPISAILARAAAMQAPGLVATLLAATGGGELERAAGAWHAEWRAQRELLRAVGSAASWLRDALEHVEPRPDRMLSNLAAAGVGDSSEGAAAGERAVDAALTVRRLPRVSVPVSLGWRADGPAGAPTLVLAGSLGSTAAMWDPLVAFLADSFRVVRCDLRGHGESPSPPAPYVIDDLGDDLVALLDELGIERAHLAGTSIGAMAAMSAAARHHDRVDRLVVIGASARFEDARPWVERARRVLVEGPEAIAEVTVARWTTPGWAADHADRLPAMQAMFRRADPAGYAGCCLALAAMDLRPLLGDIRAPTLVLCGRDDAATPPKHSEIIARGIAGARLELLDDAAHLPSIERPDRVSELVAAHLRAREARRVSTVKEIR